MEGRLDPRWLWIVTVANAIVTAVIAFLLFATLLALAAMAAEVETWELGVSLILGVLLSGSGLTMAVRGGRRRFRWLALAVNGGSLSLSIAVIAGIGYLILGTARDRYLIPEGYQGDVYVIFTPASQSRSAKAPRNVTYRIPDDGILSISQPEQKGWTKSSYYYERNDGTLRKINEVWYSTVPDTPEDAGNNRDAAVFYPDNGSIGEASACHLEFDHFVVGTKAYFLRQYKEKDLYSYVHDRGVGCFAGESKK